MLIHLKNFQSIPDAEIEIGPLTVLVGQSDVGKSAVIRALYLLHRNQGGLELVKHGKAYLEVSQTLDNGVRVAIRKGKGINSYFSGTSTFSKIGREVPEEVSRELRTQELVLDKDQSLDLNFSRQFDTPFLLSDSTSIITKAISSLSGINIIYSAIREGNAEQQKDKTKIEVLQSTIVGLLKYDNLSTDSDSLIAALGDIKDTQNKVELLKQTVQQRQKLLESLEAINKREVDLQPFTESCSSITKDWSTISGLRTKLSNLSLLHSKFFGIPSYVLTEDFSKDVEFIEKDLGNLEYAFGVSSKKRENLEALTKKLMAFYLVEQDLSSIDVAISRHAEEIARIESLVKVCPTCGRPM